jgi:hypothetical protein
MSKLSQFIVRHNVQDGYSVAYAVERIAFFLRCSQDEILTGALNDEKAARYLLGVAQRLAA